MITKKDKIKKWYCYVCGKKLLKSYYLVSMNDSTDRVFLCCNREECIEQIDSEEIIIVKAREIE